MVVSVEMIKQGIQEGEMEVHIQPIFDVDDLKVVAGEALVRWRHNNEIIMPDDFIPLLEENRGISAVDFYMLEELCKHLRRWMDSGNEMIPISINQSRLNLSKKSYLKMFCKIVDHYDIPHQYIIFELTETVIVEDSVSIAKFVKELHQNGFRFAIDDFGVGYSSLFLLTTVPADYLKIDKSFLDDCICNEKTRIVIENMVQVAHRLRIKVICEGIETLEQLDFLRSIYCDMGQGFYIGKAIETNEFVDTWMLK